MSIPTRLGVLSIRDATAADAEAYVNYWHYSGEKIKDLLGIDRQKLGTPEDSRRRFHQMIRVPGTDQQSVVFIITLNEYAIGYTNINRYGPDDTYPHLHMYRSSLRFAVNLSGIPTGTRKGMSIAAILVGPGLGMYFDLFPIRRLVLQTSITNNPINCALNLYMPPAETKYLQNCAGLAAPGEQHLRYVRREDIPWMLARSEYLNRYAYRRNGTNRSQAKAAAGDFTGVAGLRIDPPGVSTGKD